MEYKELKEVCKINMGQSPDSSSYNDKKEGLPFYQGNADFGERYPITRVWCNAPTKIAQPEDILISVRAPIGALNYTKEECCIGRGLAAITPNKSKVSSEFVYWFLKGKNAELNSKGTGSTFKAINRKILEETMIPDLDFEKQHEYAQILEKTYDVIQQRKYELEQFDELIRSRFVEMFGDPEENQFEWITSTVGNLISSCEAGWSGNGTQRKKNDGEIAVLKVSAVTKGYFDPDECKVLDDQDAIKKYVYPQAGDLLFSRANTREMVGATAVITQDYPEHILPDKLWKVRFCDVANVWYMKYILSSQSIRSIFSSVSTGTSGSMFNVSMEKFKSIRVPLPPIELQQQFADFVAQVDKSKVAVQKIFKISHFNGII